MISSLCIDLNFYKETDVTFKMIFVNSSFICHMIEVADMICTYNILVVLFI
jgi:hypothetical protein